MFYWQTLGCVLLIFCEWRIMVLLRGTFLYRKGQSQPKDSINSFKVCTLLYTVRENKMAFTKLCFLHLTFSDVYVCLSRGSVTRLGINNAVRFIFFPRMILFRFLHSLFLNSLSMNVISMTWWLYLALPYAYGLCVLFSGMSLLWRVKDRKKEIQQAAFFFQAKYVIYPIHYIYECIMTRSNFYFRNLYAVIHVSVYFTLTTCMEKEAGNRKQIAKK